MKTASKTLAVAFGLLLGLAATAAQATVVYQWHMLSSSGDLVPSAGTLVVTDAAWSSGSLAYYVAQTAVPGDSDPSSPIIVVGFTVDGSGTGWGGPLSVVVHPRTGEAGGPGPWTLDASLGFMATGFLTGSLYANDQQSDYHMTSNASGSIWTIDPFNTDAPLGSCHFAPGCSGATGFWQIETAVAVPGPTGLGLFGLGLFLLGIGVRYARKVPQPGARR